MYVMSGLHVLFSYTRIYINSTSPASYFSFTVSLFVVFLEVKLPKVGTYN